MAILEKVLLGRKAVEEYRATCDALYTDGRSEESIHQEQMILMRELCCVKLKEIGFFNLIDFINKSEEADKNEGLEVFNYWE